MGILKKSNFWKINNYSYNRVNNNKGVVINKKKLEEIKKEIWYFLVLKKK
jgi:hypothetical protein